MTTAEYTAEQLSKINDTMRVNLIKLQSDVQIDSIKGRLVITRSVTDLRFDHMMVLLAEVARFNNFSESTDPHREHDFGSVDLFGEKWFWKFDYYDENFEAFGHDVHVLTIMNASDY
ncbi:MAG: DUF3768 domain-containing protein [Ignavibacteriales bacterium]|nr:DUF3768 domain-containing protein [Ignavibacteriales bacterium]